MSHRQPIDALRAGLHQALALKNTSPTQPWGHPTAMHEVLASIQRDLGAQADTRPPQDKVEASLLHYQKTRELPNFNSLKYVCYGITVPIGLGQWRVIDDQLLCAHLFAQVRQRQGQAKQLRRCYQGLLESYFSFSRQHRADNVTQTNWGGLRRFLSSNLDPVLQASSARGEPPPWLTTLAAHRNLLGDDPCSRYAAGFMHDEIQEFRTMCATLDIPGNSWIWEDALLAYVRAVCQSPDDIFKRRMPKVLALVDGKLDMRLPHLYAVQAVGMTVARYAACQDKSADTGLLDACIKWIGSPWRERTKWDAAVNNEAARKMVEGWLNRQNIRDFFALLAEDGTADLRRLNYWLKWEQHISEMWFALGYSAASNHSPAFVEVRKRMEGRNRVLRDNNPYNNAFIMRIGQLLVIEFGLTGNACYVFAAADFATNLSQPSFSIHELKQRSGATRLLHGGDWEFNFDQKLRWLLQKVPLTSGNLAPASSSSNTHHANTSGENGTPKKFVILSMCGQHGLKYEDNRPYGGAFWVLIESAHPAQLYPRLTDFLEQAGFKWRPGRGYWIKGEIQ